MNEIDLAFAGHFVFDGAANEFFVKGCDDGLNGEAVARRRFDQRHVAEADERHVQRAGNRSGGEGEGVDIFAHFL